MIGALTAGSKVLVCMRAGATREDLESAKTYLSDTFPDIDWHVTAGIESLAVQHPEPEPDALLKNLAAMVAVRNGETAVS